MLLHDSSNRNRFKDKIMQHFRVLQRPLRVRSGARRCRHPIGCGASQVLVRCDLGVRHMSLPEKAFPV
ncbi:MAG TPA: hypothetical protein VD840_03675, partial [Sinorhizobium sp.]|nr:hypothetical protein [Sinorhizobium sp.]